MFLILKFLTWSMLAQIANQQLQVQQRRHCWYDGSTNIVNRQNLILICNCQTNWDYCADACTQQQTTVISQMRSGKLQRCSNDGRIVIVRRGDAEVDPVKPNEFAKETVDEGKSYDESTAQISIKLFLKENYCDSIVDYYLADLLIDQNCVDRQLNVEENCGNPTTENRFQSRMHKFNTSSSVSQRFWSHDEEKPEVGTESRVNLELKHF